MEATQQRPWLYPYRQDAQLGWHGEPVMRPFLPVSLVNGALQTPRLAGLVSSGADLTLASDLLAEDLGIDLEDNEGEGAHRAGVTLVRARYKTIDLRLYYPEADRHSPDDLCLHSTDAEQDGYRQWRTKIGFVQDRHSNGLVLLGSIGFFDQFRVSISASSQAVAVEDPSDLVGSTKNP